MKKITFILAFTLVFISIGYFIVDLPTKALKHEKTPYRIVQCEDSIEIMKKHFEIGISDRYLLGEKCNDYFVMGMKSGCAYIECF